MTTTTLLLGTNTASIVRRVALNNWEVAMQASLNPIAMHYVYNLTPIPGDSRNIWSWLGQFNPPDFNNNVAAYTTSLDRGENWATYQWNSTALYHPVHDQQIANLISSIAISRDELGRVYVAGFVNRDSSSRSIMRLDGYAGNNEPAWVEIFNQPVFQERPTWAGDGYVWFVYDDGGDLYRMTYDGTVLVYTPATIQPSAASHYNMAGKHLTSRLYLYEPIFKSNTTSTPGRTIYTIDITDINAPVITQVDNPFDNDVCVYIEIASNLVAYAYTVPYLFPIPEGSVWKTVNGGAIWTRVIDRTAALSIPSKDIFFSHIVYSSISAISEDEVWVAGLFPQVFHTVDGGLIWDSEVYNGPVLPSPGDTDTGATNSRCWSCILAIGSRSLRRIPQVTLIGAT